MRNILLLTIFSMVLLGCANTTPKAPDRANIAGGATQAVEDRISVDKDQITFTPGGPTPKTLDITATDTAIYQTGYYNTTQTDSWIPFTLNGTQPVGQWLIANAETTLTFNRDDIAQDDTIQIIIYTCTWTQGQWNCHGNQWQEVRTAATKQTCSTEQCYAENECYQDMTQHPAGDNTSICMQGIWTDTPDQPPDFDAD